MRRCPVQPGWHPVTPTLNAPHEVPRGYGHLRGRDDMDYVLGAKPGQHMTVEMHTDNPHNYFNILPPAAATRPSLSAVPRAIASKGPSRRGATINECR